MTANTTDANIALGIAYTVQTSRSSGAQSTPAADVGIPYILISVSLNVLLTLMIAIRIIRNSRGIRGMATSTSMSERYKTIITTLTQSCALYTVNSLLFVASWGAGNCVAYIFMPILAEVQVCLVDRDRG